MINNIIFIEYLGVLYHTNRGHDFQSKSTKHSWKLGDFISFPPVYVYTIKVYATIIQYTCMCIIMDVCIGFIIIYST